MKALAEDTPPEVERILVEGYRRMSPAQKIRRVCELCRASQQMALARIAREHPDETERERQLRLASLWLSRAQMMSAFGWDPDEKGY